MSAAVLKITGAIHMSFPSINLVAVSTTLADFFGNLGFPDHFCELHGGRLFGHLQWSPARSIGSVIEVVGRAAENADARKHAVGTSRVPGPTIGAGLPAIHFLAERGNLIDRILG